MKHTRRLIAVSLAALFVFTLSFPLSYIALEAHHHCTGENCRICHVIQNCRNTLASFSSICTAKTEEPTAPCAEAVYIAFFPVVQDISHTLVSLKVKLSD